MELGVLMAGVIGFPASMLFYPVSALGFPVGWLLFMVLAPSGNAAVLGALVGLIRGWYRHRQRRAYVAPSMTPENDGAA